MKNQPAVNEKVCFYKQQLALAMEEKMLYEDSIHPDIDIIIFSLVDKIETLMWVLDAELPDHDLWEQINRIEH